MANLETECTNNLNAEFFSNKLQYYMGISSVVNLNKDITVSELWSFDDQTMEYTALDAANAGLLTSAMQKSGEDCTCSNYLTEVEWDVNLALT